MATEHIVFDRDEVMFVTLDRKGIKHVDKAFELLQKIADDNPRVAADKICRYCLEFVCRPACLHEQVVKFIAEINAARSQEKPDGH
jgi:hypothetical protein